MPHTNVLTIDLAALRSNLDVVRRLVGPKRAILACVKANAYGHGLVDCARTLLKAGVNAVGVARLDEAMTLRDVGVRERIVLLGPESLGATSDLVALNVEILVDSIPRLEAVLDAARRWERRAVVHLALDTGMGRFEATPEEAWPLVERLAREKGLRWEGVMTHFPVADTDPGWTREQWARFDRATSEWASRGIAVPTRHAANSAAIISLPEAHADMVRPGLMLYGMLPAPDTPRDLVRPVLRWQTQVAALHAHAPGDSIGYGRTFVAARPTIVATLPVGYGDGLPWCVANVGWMLIRGRRAPIIGRISMDQTTVDVTDIPAVEIGDEAVLVGRQGGEVLTPENWARWAGTINYEITTQLMPRIPRVPVDGGQRGE